VDTSLIKMDVDGKGTDGNLIGHVPTPSVLQ